MVEPGVECDSDDEKLGNFDNVWECADACQQISKCKYFIYGTGGKEGECFWEKTESADCPDDWIDDDKYDFYEIISKLNSDRLIEFLVYSNFTQ